MPGMTACAVYPQVEVSPLENAIQVVENKNQELRALISQYQHKQVHGNINLLSMCLNGVIDAAVNGGIARYQEVSSPDHTRSRRPSREGASWGCLLETPASQGSLPNCPLRAVPQLTQNGPGVRLQAPSYSPFCGLPLPLDLLFFIL